MTDSPNTDTYPADDVGSDGALRNKSLHLCRLITGNLKRRLTNAQAVFYTNYVFILAPGVMQRTLVLKVDALKQE